MLKAYGVIKDAWGAIKYNGGDIYHVTDTIVITKTSQLVKIVDNKSAVMVGSASTSKGSNGVCECESYNLYYGKKVSCDFRKKVVKIAKGLWPSNYKEMANGLMAVMHRETNKTFAANQLEGYISLNAREKMTKDIFNKTNPSTGGQSSRAVGLIQFTQNSLVQMGEFKDGDGFDALHNLKLSYAKMTELTQLDKVNKYMKSVKSLPEIPEDIYVAVFAPAYVGDPRDNVMYAKGTTNYASNASLDKDNNGIQIKELLNEFETSLAGGVAYSNYKCENSGNNNNEKKCPDGKCVNYADVVSNPKISDDNQGKTHNRFNSKRGQKDHRGIDILTGDNKVEVHSLLCGEVVFIKTSFASNEYDATSLGNLVVVKSNDKDDKIVYLMYCHLDTVKVAKDDKVKHNEILGNSGSTGNAGSVFKNGVLIHGIYPKYYHIHIEAATSYISDSPTFMNVSTSRVNPENYMKTKFDDNGDKI